VFRRERELRFEKDCLRVIPVFLLGDRSNLKSKDKVDRDAKIDDISERFGLNKKLRVVVEKEKDILGIDIKGVDCFVVFPYSSKRFSALFYVAESRLPVIIAGEENSFCHAFDTYEYLADYKNVEVSFGPEEVKRKISVFEAVKWIKQTKICVFDAEKWQLDGIAWHKNPIVLGRLNTCGIDEEKFYSVYKKADREKAESLARKWMKDSKVLEPSFEDVTKSARVYIAMKTLIEDMEADAAYVLWCGQFTKKLGTKMCFAMAKLSDDGYPVGCWRGENLLPLLILHSASKKPTFVCEAHTRSGNTVAFRHCFVSRKIASCKYVLRRWRDMEGTVTGYCQLPKGEVTLVNCGIGNKIVVVKGKMVDCKDLGGENCRMTIWVEIEDEESIQKFVGREFAMVYGDYEKEAREIGEKLGLKVL
jgi:L-fucose isomerase-like protein